MGSKKNNTSLSDLKFGQDLTGLQDKDLQKINGGKTKNNTSTNGKWNGCGDIVPL